MRGQHRRDAAKPELKARVQQGDQVEERTLGDNAGAQAFGVTLSLKDGELLLDSR